MCFITNKLFYLMKSLLSAIIPTTLLSIIHSSASLNTAADMKTRSIESAATTSTNAIITKGSPTCPGSPAFKNASCSMVITFPRSTTCSMVQSEITSRMNGVNGWVDPHNSGTYSLLNNLVNIEEQMSQLTGSRTTADGKYTDIFLFVLEEDSTGESGCILSGCSESQVFSVLDFSTNYCNLRNLYCNNKDDGCQIVDHDFDYEETYLSCWQNDGTRCIAGSDSNLNVA